MFAPRLLVSLVVLASFVAAASAQVKGPIVGTAERSDTSKPLRELAKEAAAQGSDNYGLGKELSKADQAIVEHIQSKYPAAARGQLLRLEDAALKKAFPEASFYVLRFRQWPVAFEVPEGLSASNIVVVTKDEAELATNPKTLAAWFKKKLPPAKNEAAQRQAATAWLRLAQELYQDGFYKFEAIDPKAIEMTADDEINAAGEVKVVPQGGNSGSVLGTLTFDVSGKCIAGQASAKLQEGIRPICQATKLLDADPLVRRMAERDILVMGAVAREYLIEQHARATPEAREAIERLWDRIITERR